MPIRVESKFGYVPINRLSVVWAQSQRPYNESWSKKIASEFDPDKFDPPVITKPNGAGYYHVVEGQHRIQAAKMAFGENEQLHCRIVEAEDPARAAEIWLGINSGRKAISPIQRFEVSVTAGREPETEINTMIHKMGYRISSSKGEFCISAVSSLIEVYKRLGKIVLQGTLLVLDKTWHGDSNAFRGELVKGYASLINEYHHIEPKRLAEIAAKSWSPNQLLMAGRLYAEQNVVALTEGINETLRAKYNRNLKEERQKLKKK